MKISYHQNYSNFTEVHFVSKEKTFILIAFLVISIHMEKLGWSRIGMMTKLDSHRLTLRKSLDPDPHKSNADSHHSSRCLGLYVDTVS